MYCKKCKIKLNGNRNKDICIDCENNREHRYCKNCNINVILYHSESGLCKSCSQLGNRNHQFKKLGVNKGKKLSNTHKNKISFANSGSRNGLNTKISKFKKHTN